jgi:drug/metabolite transporter (DMT)-like permease
LTKDKLGIIYALIAATSMGTTAIFTKITYSMGATPLTILTIRFGIASVILWVYLYLKKQLEAVKKDRLIGLIALGLIYGISSFMYFTSIDMTSASIATLLVNTAPVFVVLTTVLIGDEKATLHQVVAIFVASVGLYLVLDLSVEAINLVGAVIGIGGGFFYGLYIVGSNRYAATLNPLLATAYTVPATFLFHFSVGTASHQLSWELPPLVWAYGIILAVFGTIIGIGFVQKSIPLIGSTKTSVIITFEPAVTVLLAALIFHEHMTPLQLLGGTLIIGAIIIIQISKTEVNKQQDLSIPKG